MGQGRRLLSDLSRSFCAVNGVTKPANLLSWQAAPTQQGYHGGDLLGIVEHLDYLADLGINAIYLTPIFQSACNHRYHTHDYRHVDPLLGGNEALRELVEAAHARGIRIVLDGVFNHASRGFFQFNDILENGPQSPWLGWFHIEGWPLSPYDGRRQANYRAWVGNRALAEIQHGQPAGARVPDGDRGVLDPRIRHRRLATGRADGNQDARFLGGVPVPHTCDQVGSVHRGRDLAGGPRVAARRPVRRHHELCVRRGHHRLCSRSACQ